MSQFMLLQYTVCRYEVNTIGTQVYKKNIQMVLITSFFLDVAHYSAAMLDQYTG